MEDMTDWETMMSVINPDASRPRPRRTSLHTLAYVLGRDNPLELAAEMEASKKVLGYVCPDVHTPIFYLERLKKMPTMINTPDPKVWGDWGRKIDYAGGASSIKEFFDLNPFPQVKGFKRFAEGTWSGGEYGVGEFIPPTYAMEVPYEPADFPYARLIIKTLTDAGFTPRLSEDDLK